MASMKLRKQGYGYGSNQNFSQHQRHEYETKQSSHVAEHGWASKAYQCSGYRNHADEMGQDWADNSTHCLAQAHSVLPSPPVHVLQENHVEKVKSQEWANNTGLGSYEAHSDGVAMHMAGKNEHDWAVKRPIQSYSPVGQNQYGQPMFKGEGKGYNYGKAAVEGGWAGKHNNYSGSNQSSYSAQAMHKQQQQQQHGWVGKPTNYTSPTKMHHSSLAMEDEADMMGKVDHGWVSSPTRANHSSFGMHKDEHLTGKIDHGWANSPTRANHSSHAMHKDEHMMGKVDHGWVSSPTRANHSSLGMHNDEHLMGKIDHDWANSPTRASHSSLAMHKDEHMMGKMDHGWVSSPTRANHSGLAMHKDEHMMGKMDHNFAMKPTQSSSQIRANQHGQSMYKAHDENAYMENGWASKSIPNQYNSQGHANYDHHDENIDDIMDEILTKYPAHNVNSNGYGNCATKSGPYVNAAQHQASYAKQQSMNWNERKEEYSSASSANKFEMMNKEEMYDSGISGYSGFHF